VAASGPYVAPGPTAILAWKRVFRVAASAIRHVLGSCSFFPRPAQPSDEPVPTIAQTARNFALCWATIGRLARAGDCSDSLLSAALKSNGGFFLDQSNCKAQRRRERSRSDGADSCPAQGKNFLLSAAIVGDCSSLGLRRVAKKGKTTKNMTKYAEGRDAEDVSRQDGVARKRRRGRRATDVHHGGS